MCSGSDAGTFLRLIDFVSLNYRLESNKEEEEKYGDAVPCGMTPVILHGAVSLLVTASGGAARPPAVEREYGTHKTAMAGLWP